MATMTKRKIGRGKPITELVKGSLEYTRHLIVRAFHREFPNNWDDGGEWMYVEDTFADFIIVSNSKLPVDEFYMVSYEINGADVTFAPRTEWEIVELGYTLPGSQGGGESTQQMTERSRREGSKFTELQISAVRLVEAKSKKKKGVPRVEAQLAEADVINRNFRRYRRAVIREAVEEARTHLHESFSQARVILTGEDAHPGDKFQRAMIREIAVVWDDIWFDEKTGWAHIAGDVIETAVGKDVLAVMRAGVMPPISLRAYGESEKVTEGDDEIEDVVWMRLTGADLVLEPGFEGAGITSFQESANNGGTITMDEIQKLKDELAEAKKTLASLTEAKDKAAVAEAQNRITELQEALKEAEDKAQASAKRAAELEEQEAKRQKELAEAAAKEAEAKAAAEKLLREKLGIGPDDSLVDALEAQAQAQEEIKAKELAAEATTYIESAVKKLSYPDIYAERVRQFIGKPGEDGGPADKAEAEAKLEEAKGLFGPLVAEERLRGMGFRGNGVQSVVPVFESETGMPEYAKVAFEITEAMVAHGHWKPRTAQRPMNRNNMFTQQYLEAFDHQHGDKLQREAASWSEAMTTSQLNTPYSVLRAIIDEAFPQLVALSIFDVGLVPNNPMRVFYEAQYEAESGTAVTVTDETVTAVDDTWVAMDFKRIDPESVVARSASGGGGTLYVLGTDYVIDHSNGQFKNFSAGAIANGATVYLSYTYKAIRKGEGLGIQRARSKVLYFDLSMDADRLATEVTDEAMKFSRSQLGYDAVGRTINLLVKEVMRRIDGNLMHDALNEVLFVANNSGGTWTAATDDEKDFVEKVGVAKTKVANRFYTPEVILMSLTNSDRISNWDSFTAAGKRPDADLTEAGYVGRLKGLPVFTSTVFSDSYAMVFNRELRMHRIYSTMEIKGPHASYDANGLMIAAEQYFVQEYNGSKTPIPEKGSFVKIA